jgi:cysteine desulfurase
MRPYFSDQFYNPSALYMASRSVKKALDEARSKVAKLLAVRPGEITFTAGGTEANNLSIRGVMDLYPKKKLLISAIEHESIRAAAEQYSFSEIKVNKYGQVIIEDLISKIDDDVVLVSIIFASNEIGTIQDLGAITEVLVTVKNERRKRGIETPLYFHTDATQAAVYQDLSPKRLGVDLMTVNGGKIYGPKQSGVLYVCSGISLKPIVYGGGQEKNLRSGTENIASCIGFAEAFNITQRTARSESERLTKLRDELQEELEKLPCGIIFHGHPKKRLPNHLSFAVPGKDNERLMMELDERGFMVATGSACSASKVETSHVLLAVGVSNELAQSTLRVTLGRQTTHADIISFVKTLTEILK